MKTKGPDRSLRLLVLVTLVMAGGFAQALDPKKPSVALDEKEFFKPELHLSTSNLPAASVVEGLANRPSWQRFLEDHGADVQIFFDPRSGTPSNVIAHIPMLPGRGVGNQVSIEAIGQSLGRKVEAVDAKVVADLVQKFLVANREAFGIDIRQLGASRAEPVSEELWHISIPQVVDGIPVRHGRIAATISHGNLVLVGTETWGNVRVDTRPDLTGDQALALGFTYAGGRDGRDELWKKPTLEIVPVARLEHQSGEAFAGPVGQGYAHRLVWAFGFVRKGEAPLWEVLVDAHTGEVLSFQDTVQYETKKVSGGIYPLTSTEICPSNDRCGTMQPDSPMPFANTGFASPNDFTNSAGLYEYSSGTATTTLTGKYVRITDNCGAVSVSSATGDINLGGVNGQHDCTSGGGSPGNTPAARSAFYEVNKLVEVARGWLPANAWLQAQLNSNVNISLTCNASWDGTSINFYKSGGGCRNTGEIAAVFDHEWGHGLDDNDTGGGLSSSSEAYADIAAIYRLQASCVGYGFLHTSDEGCGQTADLTGFNGNEGQNGTHCDLDCSGVRDADWDKHAHHSPDTPQNYSCIECFSGSGPCGRQVHCAAAPARQAAWDFVARDLTAAPFNLSTNDAFLVGMKVFLQGSGNIGSWHACTCPSTSNGCGATNGYMQWLAADDDNGNLNDGTPHMTALHAAFNRHNIACATPTVQNSGCALGPTTAPTLQTTIGSNQISLSWSTVPGAVTYRVLRSEGYAGCDFGKAVIANVVGTNYTDPAVANGRAYSYVVQAVGVSSACFGPGSTCVTATPQPCAGSVGLDRGTYNCNDTMSITLVDSDLTGAGSQSVAISSGTEPAAETAVLTEGPPNSGRFSGSFLTTSAPAQGGDGKVSVVNGDTVNVRYTDASYCGTPNVAVDRSSSIDCIGPEITNVRAENVTGITADIKWDTDEAANSRVTYGTTTPPTVTVGPDASFVTSHTVKLSGLTECTPYYYEVGSSDPAANSTTETNDGAYFTFETGKNVNPTYTATDTPVGIPDNTTVTSEITVTDVNTIVDVNVQFDITHTYDADLDIFLVGPNGTRVELSTDNGADGNDFDDTIFDDEAATSVVGSSAPFAGSFRPEAPLSALDGILANGTWTLEVTDDAGVDVGSINSFKVILSYPPRACGPSLKYKTHTVTESCGGAGTGGGNGVVDPGEDLVLPVQISNDGTDPTTGITARLTTTTPGVTVVDDTASYPNLNPDEVAYGDSPFTVVVGSGVPCGTVINFQVNATANEGTFGSAFTILVGTPGVATNTYDSTDVPKPIPDNTTITSTLSVADTSQVLDVNVGLSLTHTFDGDLDIFLIGPNGTRVELSTDNGGTGENFTDTVFDDEAATSITAGTPPYTGSFRPEGSLATLDGIPANGTWTLEITDDAGIDVGNLIEWSVTLTTTAAPTCESCSVTAPSEVIQLLPGSNTSSFEWTMTAGASFYNLYRGDPSSLPDLLTGSPDSCRRLTTASTTTGSVIMEEPGEGSFHWFLVRAGNAGGEGPPGFGRSQESYGACP